MSNPGANTLDQLLSRIPEVDEALDRIPTVLTFLRRALGEPTQFWHPDEPADVTNKILCAGIQLEVEELQRRFKGTEDKLAVVKAAERNWRIMFQARSKIVLTNAAGELAELPVDLARMIAAKRPLDVEVEERGTAVLFSREGETLASFPKTLFAVLEKVLERHPWERGKSRAQPSQSQDSQVED